MHLLDDLNDALALGPGHILVVDFNDEVANLEPHQGSDRVGLELGNVARTIPGQREPERLVAEKHLNAHSLELALRFACHRSAQRNPNRSVVVVVVVGVQMELGNCVNRAGRFAGREEFEQISGGHKHATGRLGSVGLNVRGAARR